MARKKSQGKKSVVRADKEVSLQAARTFMIRKEFGSRKNEKATKK